MQHVDLNVSGGGSNDDDDTGTSTHQYCNALDAFCLANLICSPRGNIAFIERMSQAKPLSIQRIITF